VRFGRRGRLSGTHLGRRPASTRLTRIEEGVFEEEPFFLLFRKKKNGGGEQAGRGGFNEGASYRRKKKKIRREKSTSSLEGYEVAMGGGLFRTGWGER